MARRQEQLRLLAVEAAQRHNVPPRMFLSLISTESSWNPHARSSAGAMGLGQLMPDTARAMGIRDPFDPRQNLEGSARYLRHLFGRFGKWPLALAAYNAGPTAVARYGRIPPYAREYVRSVIRGAANEQVPAPRRGRRPAQLGSFPPSPAPSAPPPPPGESPPPVQVLSKERVPVVRLSPSQTGFQVLAASPGVRVLHLAPRSREVIRPPVTRGSKQNPAVDVDVPPEEAIEPRAAQVLKMAYKYLGTPYKWGGASPSTGFDCSGFVQWLYRKVGIDLPRTTWGQLTAGRAVAREDLEPGDLIFFGNGGHVGLYIGGGQFIHAPRTGDVIKISSLNDPWYRARYLTARRVLG